MVVGEAGWPGRFADNEFRGEPDDLRKSLLWILNTFDQNLGGGPSHRMQRLSDGSKAWVGVGGDQNVIETDDRDVAGAGESGIFDGPNSSDCSSVVEAEDRRKVAGTFKKFVDRRITKIGRPGVFLQINAELRLDYNSEPLRDGMDGPPARLGIKRERLSLHEGDAAVTKVVEVLQGEACGMVMIENNIGNTGNVEMGGDPYGRQRDLLAQLRIDQQQTIDGTADQQVRILLDEVRVTEMADSEVEIAGLEEILFNTGHKSGEVAFAELGYDDTDRIGKPRSQHASVHVGPVVKLFRGIEDALTRLRRYGLSHRRVVKDDRYRCRRKVQIIGKNLEGYRFRSVGELFPSGNHEAPGVQVQRMQQFYTVGIEQWNISKTATRKTGAYEAEWRR